MNRQHSGRRTTQRLLLLAGATIGISAAITVGLSDDAHASDRDLPALVEGVTETVTSIAAPATAPAPVELVKPVKVAAPTATPVKAHHDKPARKPSRPHPVRDAVQHGTGTVDKTIHKAVGTTKRVTDRAGTATRDVPVVGDTVDQVSDVTEQGIPASTAPPVTLDPVAQLPPPAAGVQDPPTVAPSSTAGRPTGGTQPAPGPTATGAPTPRTVDPGAASPSLNVQQRQRPAHGLTAERHLTPVHRATPRPAGDIPLPLSGGWVDSRAVGPAQSGVQLDAVTGDQARPPATAAQNPAGHHGDHTGRSWPPSLPAG